MISAKRSRRQHSVTNDGRHAGRVPCVFRSIPRLRRQHVALTLALGMLPNAVVSQDVAAPASKDHATFRELFAPACVEARQATIKVRRDGMARALGTVVDARGFAITKASEFDGATKIECELADGSRHVVRAGPVDAECDLLLLDLRSIVQTAKPTLKVVRSDAAANARGEVAIGNFIACVGHDPEPFSVGVISLLPYTRVERGMSRARLPLPFKEESRSACVGRVDESPFASTGLQEGDVIESVDARAVSSARSFHRAIRRKTPGQRVTLEVRRGVKLFEIEVEVEGRVDRSGRRDPQQALWGRLSQVRFGFPEVLQHDAVIDPNECGGPVIDIEGRFLGVNIARVGRVETHALPATLVLERARRLIERMTAPSVKKDSEAGSKSDKTR
ncbi:MAG: PDZ domain-containing protein [Planctomycetes bacterium]|nr:PDZ domain-containing protein [Planctomycetota bacterium]MCB9918022.1 PDZ domain-containing protein [Planctomycetota bacterium]